MAEGSYLEILSIFRKSDTKEGNSIRWNETSEGVRREVAFYAFIG